MQVRSSKIANIEASALTRSSGRWYLTARLNCPPPAKLPIVVIVIAVALVAAPLFAWSQGTASSFQLTPGIVVDLDKNQAYVMRPEGGVLALDLSHGAEVWSSVAAAKPLTLAGDILVSQAEPEGRGNELKIVSLSTSEEGRQIFEKTIPLPPAVKTSVTRSVTQSFNAEAHVAAGEAAVSWQYKERIAQGMRAGHEVLPGEAGPTESELPPGALREEREHGGESTAPKVMDGAFRLNLQSGAVTPQRPDRAALAAPLTGRAVRLAAGAALAGVSQPQFVSADGRYVLSAERAPNGSALEQYVWTLYDRSTGERIGQFKTHVHYAPFFVTGTELVYQIGPFERSTDTGVVEEPAQIGGVDLKTGNTLWVAPIRDIVDRTSPPP
jgi:hypothetical protein